MFIEKKRRFFVKIQYQGTHYFGWQTQKKLNIPTIQSLLEEAFFKRFAEKVNFTASGRTDTGVHARGQVAHFDTSLSYPEKVFQKALNATLSQEIRIIKIKEVPKLKRFHARFSVQKKKYSYRIYNGEIAPLFMRNYVHVIQSPLMDLKKLESILILFKGEKSFHNFSIEPDDKNCIREIYSIELKKKKNLISISFIGSGFLRKMIRILVGTSLYLIKERKENFSNQINSAFCLKERTFYFKKFIAPSRGLCLEKVWYKKQ